ncbi:flagellar export chaperone FlgN [Paraburkholderia bonniea]|uniref:flagellar export chaperone FlgN n=1 Tax=Paraburkholderia bonniea TaxID=2152891 RepID=UPI001292768D|nr:flagellar export chaperone FlgN [Paraburkholderia bonniea]WJF90786.1 flagellar export chaperone FlgN [Paraburkholderia bonniea]WJF94100.1 flagellar export chaperone FlgN [Paraburkholderia bonniea]
MTRQAALRQVVTGLTADLEAYRVLQRMLDEQFAVAQRLDAPALKRLGEAINHELERLELNQRTRRSLLGGMPGAFQRLLTGQPGAAPSAAQTALAARYAELEALVARCKALAARNSSLLAGQFETMQRMLHGEKHTYVPY